MDRFTYRQVSTAQLLSQAFPQGASTDTVYITITNLSTGASDTAQTAMTNVTGPSWKYTWTPNSQSLFLIDYWNQTLDVHYYEYAQITSSPASIPSGSVGGSTLTTLRTKLLKLLDRYNGDDLTGTNSSGEIADLCINDALQLIYGMAKGSRYMEAYPSTSLSSTIDQEYIDLGGITDADHIRTVRDTTNNITLIAVPYWLMRLQVPNPAQSTGTPFRYARLFNRIYVEPRPTAVINYTIDYIKFYPQLTSDSDQALIPSHYDDWIIKEAMVKWFLMESPSEMPAAIVAERNDARKIFLNDIQSEFDKVTESQSHWNEDSYEHRMYKRPVG